jgi:NitT/TauT family transport system substrate-binding protein
MSELTDTKISGFDRRTFLANASALSAASLLAVPRAVAAEPPPETRQIRLVHAPAICLAPQYLAEELLRLEGFSEVSYVEIKSGEPIDVLYAGEADISMEAAPCVVYRMDGRTSVVAIAGIHSGCFELFGNGSVQTIRDLKGKTVAVYGLGGPAHVLIASMLAYVGMDPQRDVTWIKAGMDAMGLFVDGKADAFMGFAPQPQELRAKGVGQVIIDTAQDRPWSQYFCCIVVANREFVTKYPVATKRALRAYLKAADICAREPERVARFMVAKGHEPRYEMALEVLKGLPYRRWRDANPEDTLRFLALRLHEVGMIKTAPQKLIANASDWRFLNELKKELKA